jgi:hypothetical protein
MNEPALVAIGRCWMHGGDFAFNPDLVPVMLIDPEGNHPADLNPDGTERGLTDEILARAVSRPYCPACAKRLNASRAATGGALIFDETDTAAGLA